MAYTKQQPSSKKQLSAKQQQAAVKKIQAAAAKQQQEQLKELAERQEWDEANRSIAPDLVHESPAVEEFYKQHPEASEELAVITPESEQDTKEELAVITPEEEPTEAELIELGNEIEAAGGVVQVREEEEPAEEVNETSAPTLDSLPTDTWQQPAEPKTEFEQSLRELKDVLALPDGVPLPPAAAEMLKKVRELDFYNQLVLKSNADLRKQYRKTFGQAYKPKAGASSSQVRQAMIEHLFHEYKHPKQQEEPKVEKESKGRKEKDQKPTPTPISDQEATELEECVEHMRMLVERVGRKAFAARFGLKPRTVSDLTVHFARSKSHPSGATVETAVEDDEDEEGDEGVEEGDEDK